MLNGGTVDGTVNIVAGMGQRGWHWQYFTHTSFGKDINSEDKKRFQRH